MARCNEIKNEELRKAILNTKSRKDIYNLHVANRCEDMYLTIFQALGKYWLFKEEAIYLPKVKDKNKLIRYETLKEAWAGKRCVHRNFRKRSDKTEILQEVTYDNFLISDFR